MIRRHAAVLCLLALLAPGLARADLVIYDDALRNGFENWSWGDANFASTANVHAGSFAIAFDAHSWQGVSFVDPGAPLQVADWPELRFWIRGTAGGERLSITLQHDGAAVASAPLEGFVSGGAIVAGQYREVVVPLSAAPLGYTGPFERIDIADASGNTAASAQRVTIDDVRLVAAGTGVVDPIFSNGFDGSGPPASGGLVIERAVAIDGLSGDRFGWTDSAGLPRSATLALNNAGSAPNGSRGGELREFRYRVGAATRTVTAVSGSAGGFGYVVSHPTDAAVCTGGGDSSSLGHFTPGTFQRVFEGRHHAILRFTQAYPRYCTTNAPATRYDLPVTIDWVIANGRDHPLWSVTWDMSGVPVNRLEDDARGPYGELRIDGAASDAARGLIAGVAWGDRYRFTSTTNPVTFASAWTWNTPNTIPFVKLWTQSDATMGIVQTRTIDQQDAGGYWGQDSWGRTSAQGNACAGGGYAMPCDYNWPFQSINYELYGGATRNARLAWGTNFGFLGQQQYRIRGNANYGGGANGTALPGDPMASGWPRKSYATHIVLGTHASDPVGVQVGQVEAIQGLSLSATIGSVATSGRAGVGDATSMTYAPAGYDPVYAALTFVAATNRLDATVTVPAGRTLRRPLIVVRQYGAGLPTTLRLDGATLVRDVDWLPSPRGDAQELWITLARDLAAGAHRIELVP